MQTSKELFRLVTIGSVDDGKSTLIGRLLYESGAIYQDQIDAISGSEIDFAALTDGLAAEREQGITIDVAYRFWDTPKRRFIIADTPGHLQYTRNMVTGSSMADAAIILVDARLGVLEQSRRHAYIASLLGVQTLIVAVNKMDTVNYDESVFSSIQQSFEQDLQTLGGRAHRFIPMSALKGDNISNASPNMPWFKGNCLVQELHNIPSRHCEAGGEGMVLPVQTVIRAPGHRRGYAGTVLCDRVCAGDQVIALPSKQQTRIAKVLNPSDDQNFADPLRTTQVQLEDELDLSRGDLLVAQKRPVTMHRQLQASLVWMHQDPLALSRSYFIKLSSKQTRASVSQILHRMDLQTLSQVPAKQLELNQIARVELLLSEPCLVLPYRENRELGSFVLIDRSSYATVAAGMIETISQDALSSTQALTSTQRARRFAQRAAHLVLFGEHTDIEPLAAHLESHLFALGHLAYALNAPATRSPHGSAVLEVLLESGHLVITTEPMKTLTAFPRVELSVDPKLGREEQLDTLVLELGTRGILGNPSDPIDQ